MNSVAPIASRANSLGRHVQRARQQQAADEWPADVSTGLHLIQQRWTVALRSGVPGLYTLAAPQHTTRYVQQLQPATRRQLLADQLAAHGIKLTLSAGLRTCPCTPMATYWSRC